MKTTSKTKKVSENKRTIEPTKETPGSEEDNRAKDRVEKDEDEVSYLTGTARWTRAAIGERAKNAGTEELSSGAASES